MDVTRGLLLPPPSPAIDSPRGSPGGGADLRGAAAWAAAAATVAGSPASRPQPERLLSLRELASPSPASSTKGGGRRRSVGSPSVSSENPDDEKAGSDPDQNPDDPATPGTGSKMNWPPMLDASPVPSLQAASARRLSFGGTPGRPRSSRRRGGGDSQSGRRQSARGAPVASSPYDAHRAGRLATRLARERRPANDTVAFPLTRRARAAPQRTGATRGWRISRRRRRRRRRARRLGRGVLLRRRRAVARVRRHRRGARLQRAAARAAPRAHARRGRRLPIDRVAGERRFALASVRDVDGGFVDWRRRRFHRGRLERRWGGSVWRWVRGRAVVVRRRRVVRGAAVGDGGQGREREGGFGESR